MAVANEKQPIVDAKNIPVQEQMLDVGGHFLYMRSAGEGSPTVILESGLGGATSAFAWLEQEIARFTRVIAYDRAGLGRSETSKNQIRFLEAVPQLHTLLEKAGEKGPFIMVGHSIGGILIREFTRRYPDEVAGLVFLDSSHPKQVDLMPPSIKRQTRILMQILKVKPLAKYFLKKMIWKDAQTLPSERINGATAEFSTDKHFLATRDEYRDSDAFFRAAQGLGSLDERPIAVFSASLPDAPFMKMWHGLQRELAALSPNSKHQIVKGARHVSLITERENALLIAAAVREMVEQLRAGSSATTD